MKKKLLDRRGAGIELAILMLVICFSLSILLTSTAAMHYGKKLRTTSRLQQSVFLEQVGQKFWSDVINGQVDENWIPADGDGFTVATEHVHNWNEEITKPATCEAGEMNLTCDCGETQTVEIPAVHNWDAGVETNTATCKQEGVMTYTCKDCGQTRTEDIPKLSHSWTLNEEMCVKAEACEKDGVRYYLCKTCNAEKSETVAAHTWDAGVETVPATCVQNGVMTYTCESCASTREEEIPCNDVHNWTAEGCQDCDLPRPTEEYSLTVYKIDKETVKVMVQTPAGVTVTTEPIRGTVILEITVIYDEVDRTYLVTEWTKNDRS